MKKLIIAALVVLGSSAIADTTIQDSKLYTHFRDVAQYDCYDDLVRCLSEYPDLLSWQDEEAGHGSLLFAFIEAENRKVLMALIRDIVQKKIYYNDKTGHEAIDEILLNVENKGIAQMIQHIAKQHSPKVDRKKKPDLVRTQPGWFSAKKLLGGSLILGAAYGGWKLYQHYYQSENEKK